MMSQPTGRSLSPSLSILIGSQVAFLSFDFDKIGFLTTEPVDVGRWLLIMPGQVVGGVLLLVLSSSFLRALRRGPALVAATWLLWGLASTAWSVDPVQTTIQSIGAINLFLIAVWLTHTHGESVFYRLTSRSIAAVVTIGVAYEMLGGVDDGSPRLEGLAEGFNQLGVLCAFGLVFAIAARLGPSPRGLDTLVAAVLGMVLIGSGARGQVIAAVAALAVIAVPVVQAHRRRALTLAVALLPVAALVAVVLASSGVFDRQEETALNGRELIWDHAADLVAAEPFVGHGAMTGLSVWTQAVVAGAVGFRAGSAHNMVLEVVVGGGMIGLGLFAGVLVVTFRGVLRWQAWDRLAVLVVLIVAGLTESLVARPSLVHWVLGGMVVLASTRRGVAPASGGVAQPQPAGSGRR